MNIGDRVRTTRGAGVINRFHYEPVSLGTRNVRRIAWVHIRYDDGTTQFVPPNTITQEDTMTAFAYSTTDIDESAGVALETPPEPDPTPPPPEPADDDEANEKLIEWP